MDKNNPMRVRINHPRPSFLEGAARVLDLGGTLRTYDAKYFEDLAEEIRAQWLAEPATPQDEAEAIHQCWVDVGNCLRHAMGMPLLDITEKRRRRMEARRKANGASE